MTTREISQAPASIGVAVAKSDSTTYTQSQMRALYVGTGGNLVLTGHDDVDFTLSNVVAGSVIPVSAKKVKDATTASDIVRLA